MSERRRSAATATVGLAGVGGAAALRHEALVRSYHERSDPWEHKAPLERPRFAAERRLLRHPRGRKAWLAGATLGAVSLPAAATGVNGVLHPKSSTAKRDDGFWREGLAGARDAAVNRTQTAKEKAPPKLVAGNYAAGAVVGSGVGGLAHLAMRKRPIPGHGKAALAAAAGTTVGTAMLPLQSRATAHFSRGKYEVTPTGVRRVKAAPKRASSKASVYDARKMDPRAFRAQTVAKMSPRTAYRTAGAHIGAHWTVQGLRAADKVDVPSRAAIPKTKRAKLVYTGRTKAANVMRAAALDVGSINDKDAMARSAIHGHPLIGKREDIGANMTRGQRRARIAATGVPVPVVGDLIQAGAAGRLSPQRYSRRTSAQTFGAGQAGGFGGNAAGAGIALGAAKLSPGFDRKAKAVNDRIDDVKHTVKNKVRTSVGAKPVERDAPSLTSRALAHQRTPQGVRRAVKAVTHSGVGRAIAHNPKVAALGALAGGSVGSPMAQQSMLTHTMNRDDRYRRSMLAKREAKAKTPIPLSQREQHVLRRRKERSAALSVLGGSTGLGALGATVGGAALTRRPKLAAAIPKTNKLIHDVQVPLLTAGAGIGGFNAFTNAAVQHKEAKQIRKALLPRAPGLVRRAPAMRKATLRQTRYPGGMVRTSTVRGGLA